MLHRIRFKPAERIGRIAIRKVMTGDLIQTAAARIVCRRPRIDAGTVAPRFDALTLGSFVSDYGIGVRFHSPVRTPLRVELAKGREGLRTVFSASAAF